MTFLNRVFGDYSRHGFVVAQDESFPLSVTGALGVHDRLGKLLFRHGCDQGVIPLLPLWLERGAGIHFISVAASQARAEALAGEAIARLAD